MATILAHVHRSVTESAPDDASSVTHTRRGDEYFRTMEGWKRTRQLLSTAVVLMLGSRDADGSVRVLVSVWFSMGREMFNGLIHDSRLDHVGRDLTDELGTILEIKFPGWVQDSDVHDIFLPVRSNGEITEAVIGRQWKVGALFWLVKTVLMAVRLQTDQARLYQRVRNVQGFCRAVLLAVGGSIPFERGA